MAELARCPQCGLRLRKMTSVRGKEYVVHYLSGGLSCPVLKSKSTVQALTKDGRSTKGWENRRGGS